MPTLTKEEELIQLVQARGDQLNQFVLGLQTSHPHLYKENVNNLLLRFGNFDYSSNKPQTTTQIDPYNLEYRSAIDLEDGGAYEGTWNKDSNKFEGLGVKVNADGSIYEGYFLNG